MHQSSKLELKVKYTLQVMIYSKAISNSLSVIETFGHGKIFNLLASESEKVN